MNTTAVVLQGMVNADGTLQLSEPVKLPAGKVQVIVQSVSDSSGDSFSHRMEAIWRSRRERGQTARKCTEVESQRDVLNAEIEGELEDAIDLQRVARQARAAGDRP